MTAVNHADSRAARLARRRGKLSLSILIAGSAEPEIVLAAGVYREQVVLERPVTLVAAGGPGSVRIVTERGPALVVRAGALLRGVIVQSEDPERAAVSVTSGAPVFEQCEFRGARVEVAGTATPIFRRCTFSGATLAGLYARERSTVRLERCTFTGIRGHALVGADSAMLEVHGSRIEDAQGAGLRLLGEARADVRDAVVSGCQAPGVVVADSGALRMVGSRVAGGAAEGVRIDGSSLVRAHPYRRPDTAPVEPEEPTPGQILSSLSNGPLADLHGILIEDCDIADAALDGIVVGGGQVRLDRVRVTGAGRAGLLVGGSARVEMRGCAVAGAADAGVLVRGTARVRAADLDVVGCGGYGVAIAEHGEVELADSRLTDTGKTAVHLLDHGVFRGVRTKVQETKGHGVYARGHAIAELTDCRIESCARDAVRIEGSADSVLRQSEFSRSRIGIVLATRHHPVLRGCRVRETERMGIVVGPGGMPALRDCLVADAGGGGIFLDHGSAAQIEDCRVEGTGGGGIVVCFGATPTVRGTSVRDTAGAGLYFHNGAAGVFEDCRVTTRAGGPEAVHLVPGATPELRELVEERQPGSSQPAPAAASAEPCAVECV